MIIKKQTKKKPLDIAENKTKNLLKKPTNGGIPAIEKSPIAKLIAIRKFFNPKDDQFAKNFG